MPYISVRAGRPLSEADKKVIITELGNKISTIPGKCEKSLMIEITDNCYMYFRGDSCEGAYIDVRLYGNADTEYKKAFTEQIFAIMQDIGMNPNDIYVTFSEFSNWGLKGSLK